LRGDDSEVGEIVEGAVRGVLSMKDPSCAVIDRRLLADGVELVIRPRSPCAAGMTLHVSRGWTYWVIGEGTLLEIGPRGKQYTDQALAEEVRMICEAVVSGRVSEKVWLRGGTVIKARSQITMGGRAIHIRYGILFNFHPFRRVVRRSHEYAEYS
jgi:hypothetical protein